jgi:hypothetical protein
MLSASRELKNFSKNGYNNYMRLFRMLNHILLSGVLLNTLSLNAQENMNGNLYDDYTAFDSDPVQLDEEVSRYFGRFFESDFLLGAGLFTGDLAKSNASGFDLGVRFVFYFDKLWGGELGAGYFSHKSFYNQSNTGLASLNINLDTVMIPMSLGLRYSFDRDNLPRGISMMNPYVAVAGELMFRSEGVKYDSNIDALTDADLKAKFAPGAVVNTTAFGVNIGGGFAFDVYKSKILLGMDVRYHFLYWPDAEIMVGNLSRTGGYFTAMGQVCYNY